MIERISELAELSVGRACGFAALAILVFAVSLSSDLQLALRATAILALVLCVTLLAAAARSDSRPYDKTELWLLLSPDERPDARVAQSVISAALSAARLKFAIHAAAMSGAAYSASYVWPLLGRGD